MLAISLCYEYTQATLSPVFLKGVDALVFNALHKLDLQELRFVLQDQGYSIGIVRDDDFDFDFECDHEQVFQGVFL